MKVYNIAGMSFDDELWISKAKALEAIRVKYPALNHLNGHLNINDFDSIDEVLLTVKAILDRDGFVWLTKGKRLSPVIVEKWERKDGEVGDHEVSIGGASLFSNLCDVQITMKTVNGTP